MSKIIKLLFIYFFSYKYWIGIRNKSKDEYGEELCYCGHTYKCHCGDPDKKLFKECVKNKTINLHDENNGWKTNY